MDLQERNSPLSIIGNKFTVSAVNPGYEQDTEETEEVTIASSCSSLSTRRDSGGQDDPEEVDHVVKFHQRPRFRGKAVVTVRDAVKSYGSGQPVLNNFNMTVQKGTIYSLLGSSGCGKTTLLSCVVGVKHLNSGQVRVFGAEPGTKESGVPGRRVGYMQQETALYNELTIAESIRYFGSIYGMPLADIETSQDFLISFLDLPDSSRRVGHLSGGQKRRVSLALSLVHSPELLILDEPTVGVDPLLRDSIWNHLCKLVTTHQTTVIITTHYVNEAMSSDTIGLMRGGRLLAEKSPDMLFKEHKTNSLEKIVLKLCKKDNLWNSQEDSGISYEEAQGLGQIVVGNNDKKNEHFEHRRRSLAGEIRIFNKSSSLNRINALIMKNFVLMTRNLLLLLFMLLVPAVTILVICTAIGNDPSPMNLGFVNHEANFSEPCSEFLRYPGEDDEQGCDVQNLACRFMDKLPATNIYLHEYKSEELARKAVEMGKIWGFMTFPETFSDAVYFRSTSSNTIDNATLQDSVITFHMDQSNKQVAGTIKRMVYDSFKEFVQELLQSCGFNPQLADLPIKYATPIYGNDETDFKEYVAPSMMLAILCFFPVCSSGINYIKEKKQGTLERASVAGVQSWEIMTAFCISEICVLIIQSALTITIMLILFGIQVKGSLALVVLLAVLIGLSGVSTGFLLSSFCREEIEVAMLAIALFFPNFCLGGLLWPLEGMPIFVQYFSYFLPCTLSAEAVRSIVTRGWGLTHFRVWPGFASTIGWISIYWICTVCIIRASRGK